MNNEVCYEQLGRYKFMASITEQQYLIRDLNVSLVNPTHCLRLTTIICTQRAYHVRMPAVQESGKCISASLTSRRKRDNPPQNPPTNETLESNDNPNTNTNDRVGPMNIQQPQINNLIATFQLYKNFINQLKSSEPTFPTKPNTMTTTTTSSTQYSPLSYQQILLITLAALTSYIAFLFTCCPILQRCQ